MPDQMFPLPTLDARFPTPGTDARFPSPGTDARFPSPNVDSRYPAPNWDNRFMGTVYNGADEFEAPSLTITHDLTDRTLTISVTDADGMPLPRTWLTALTLDGDDVWDDAEGINGPWTYEVPSSEDAQVVAWEVTAMNGQSPDAVKTGTLTVAADITPDD